MSNAFLAQLPHIGTVSTLGWQNDALAQSYMDHILQRARVLLPRRGWRVGVIKEFYPRGASLLGLNVNAGSEVCVRFRVPGKRNEFLPFHEVLCTALHEFTHCVHSRHDRAFWSVYYDLVKECEALEVTMIQQGKQLYPEAAYVPGVASSTTCCASPLRGGHRLGGVAQASPGRGGGVGRGGTATRGRNGGTRTATVTARLGKLPKSATGAALANSRVVPSSPVFPGEGRRLGGGGGLRPFDAPPGFTPTRDALRRVLAAAAERRQGRSGSTTAPAANVRWPVETSIGASPPPSLLPKHETIAAAVDDGAAGEAEADVPDYVPARQTAVQDADGYWKCPRCGFCNEAGARGCQFCGNDDTAEDAADGDEPPMKKKRSEVATEVVGRKVSVTPAARKAVNCGTSREEAIEVSESDDDDAHGNADSNL